MLYTLSKDDDYFPYLRRAMDRFSRQKLVERGGLPQPLCHYTSLSALFGMLRTSTVWASQSNFLNDDSEIHLAYQTLARGGGGARARFFRHSDTEVDFYERIATELKTLKDLPTIFAVSFCDDSNLLSQWRAYSRDCDEGVCVKFSPYGITDGDESTLIKVVYGSQQSPRASRGDPHREVVDNYLSSYLIEYITMIAESDLPREEFISRCIRDFSILSPYLKHGDFFEEREWRIVLPADQLKSHHVIKKGSGRRSAPYVELQLRDTNLRKELPISGVTVGPNPDQDGIVAKIIEFTKGGKYEYLSGFIDKSTTPFRW